MTGDKSDAGNNLFFHPLIDFVNVTLLQQREFLADCGRCNFYCERAVRQKRSSSNAGNAGTCNFVPYDKGELIAVFIPQIVSGKYIFYPIHHLILIEKASSRG